MSDGRINRFGKMKASFSTRVKRMGFLPCLIFTSFLGTSTVLMTSSNVSAEESIQDALRRSNVIKWTDKFDNTVRAQKSIETKDPIISPHTAHYMQQAISRYKAFVQQGDWAKIPTNDRLSLGMRHRNVLALRARLMAEGDLVTTEGLRDMFDAYVDAAVRRFQSRHGLNPTGVVDKDTIAAMNVSAKLRLKQLEINYQRVSQLSPSLEDTYVLVNIPAASIEAIGGGLVESRHIAIVGKQDRQTPILSSKIHQINFNPYWHSPKSIVEKDIIPAVREDPEYLSKNHIRILGPGGREMSPAEIDWSGNEAVKYLFRQDPGEKNAMAHVKINFHNKHAVYLHDTPSKSLFGNNYRFNSSGCVRVENVRGLVKWLMQHNLDYDEMRLSTIYDQYIREDVALKVQVPIHTTYVTAWANKQGTVSFRDDIYAMDGIPELAKKL